MKTFFLFLILFLSLYSSSQSKISTDSLDKVQFEEMNKFFFSVDSMELSDSLRTELQYKKLKSFIQGNPTNGYNGMFIAWGKYFDESKIDNLYSLMDSSLQKEMARQKNYQKIRSTVVPGMPFPKLILTDTLNKQLDIADLKGKIVFIDIWSSSCAPCRKEMQKLKVLYEKYSDNGFIVIAISLDDDKEDWVNAIAKDQQPWLQFCELKTWQNNSMLNKWGVVWLPYNFLIDRQGKLIDKEINIDKLEEKILSLQ